MKTKTRLKRKLILLMFSLFIMASLSLVLSACIKDPEAVYTISFETDGGSEVASITQERGKPIQKPDDPEKQGHTFAGWYTRLTLGDIYQEFTIMPDANLTLYAHWTINQYTYTFFDEDGETALKSETINYGSAIVPPSDPKKDPTAEHNYTFSGWQGFTVGMTIEEDITFTAQYSVAVNTYDVTLPTGIGYTAVVSEGSASPVDYGGSYSFVVTLDTSYSESDFIVKANGVAVLAVDGVYTINNISEDQVITVEGVTLNTYDITLPTGTGYTAVVSEGSTSPVDYDGSYNFTVSLDIAYNDSDFKVKANGVELIAVDSVYTINNITEDQVITVEGVELNSYAIIYVLGGGTNHDFNPSNYTMEDEVTLLDPSRGGYSFDGWYSDADHNEKVNKIMPGSSGTKTLYAKWLVMTNAITYVNLNGGTHFNPETYTIESPIIILMDAERVGFTFDGWYGDSAYTKEVKMIETGSYGDKTLYAKWNPIAYTITYENLNGGIHSNPTTYTVDSADIILMDIENRADFDGWYSDSAYTEKVTKIESGSYGNITLYAKWLEGNYIWDIAGLSSLELNGEYILACDIDLGGVEWVAIGGDFYNPFTGSFNGNGFKIYNFQITEPLSYLGLFGYNKGTLKNLGVESFTINIDSSSSLGPQVGALVAENHGTIINCYASGNINVSFLSAYVGGLAGRNSGIMYNCYSTVKVTVSSKEYTAYVGGLVGYNIYGTMVNCYATGNVDATATSNAYAGGLVGNNISSTIINSFATGDVSAMSSDVRVGGLVGNSDSVINNSYRYDGQNFYREEGSEIFDTASNYLGTVASIGELQSSNFVVDTLKWTENELWLFDEGKFPVLNFAGIKDKLIIVITDVEKFKSLSGGFLILDYILTCDIDLDGMEWTPMTLYGTFDGDGYKVSNLSIIDSHNYVGLFGINYGTIKNLGVETLDINTYNSNVNYSGAVVGSNQGTMINCYAMGNVSITSGYSTVYAGGLVGENKNGAIINCYATGNVSATSIYVFAGGLVGYNQGTLTNCYATGDVDAYADEFASAGGLTGENQWIISGSYTSGNVSVNYLSSYGLFLIGGLVGSNSGSIINCYSQGVVGSTIISEDPYNYSLTIVGGLVGDNNYGTIANCYALGHIDATSADIMAGGFIGSYTGGTITSCFATGNIRVIGDGMILAGGFSGSDSGTTLNLCYRSSEQTFYLENPFFGVYYEANIFEGIETEFNNLQSHTFLTETLLWSNDIWTFTEGSFPTLSWQILE